MEINEILVDVQKRLKAPKGQKNTFGNYNYRSCEDIVEAVKPLLHEHGAHLLLWDSLENIGDRYYVKATAGITYKDTAIQVRASARGAESQKGMDESQITGAASSYARKYALNGLFAIDDTKDADTQDNRNPTTKIDQKAKKEFHTQMLEAIHEGSETKLRQSTKDLRPRLRSYGLNGMLTKR